MDNKYILLTITTSPELKVRYQSAEYSPNGSIIFVHDICHGAWCFENFMNFFSENGYDCFALNLRGHGDNGRKDLKYARLSDYADDVKKCVDYCTDYCNKKGITEKPFLLGHSMGGAVIQKYIGDYSDTVKGAILFASATAKGISFYQIMIKSIYSMAFYAVYLKAFGFILSNRRLKKSAFFNNRISLEKAKQYNKLLHKESKRIILHDLYISYTHNYNLNIPILIIGSRADSFFSGESLIKTMSCYQNSGKLVMLENLCHDMMLDPEWKKSAKAVLEFMEN